MPITEETLAFLAENRLRDSRAWFHEHKARYRQAVLAPMMELVEQMTEGMLAIDPMFVTQPRVDRTISRIYRDTRFSKDKTLYRDVMWCVFAKDKRAFPAPACFAVEFSPRRFRYGCGYYCAPPRLMEQMRALILKKDAAFLAAKRAYEAQDVFQLGGERYKRSKFPDQPEKLRDWLDRKSIELMCESDDFDLLFSDRLAQTLLKEFEKIKQVYDFFEKAGQAMREEEYEIARLRAKTGRTA